MAQAIRLLRDIGEEALVRGLLLGVLVEDVAPMVTGLALLGRAGLAIHAELAAARRAGGFRTLDAMGIDPLAMLVVPRCAAAAAAGAALATALTASALVAGYAVAETRGFFAPGAVLAALRDALTALGPAPLLLGALKAGCYAFACAVAFSRAALEPEAEGEDAASAAFRNALIGFLLIAFLFAVAR
jgi:phospholipid/cholesterol/gamma-HCH transport system permease protein